MSLEGLPSLDDFNKARERISPYINQTPVLTCSTLNQISEKQLYFKCENFQKVGAFKFRGACNAILKLTEEERAKGVVTHSSGNHAQALSLAAKLFGVKAYIVMPNNAPKVKIQGVIGYGGEVILCDPKAREETAKRVQDETGAIFISPANAINIIEGTGTISFEFLEEIHDLDVIICPVGGGGLISGVCLVAKYLKPEIKIIGAEPLGANDAFLSKLNGELIPQTNPCTIADGLRTSLGDITWRVVRDHVDEIITVTEQEIFDAMFLVWERMKIIIELCGSCGCCVI